MVEYQENPQLTDLCKQILSNSPPSILFYAKQAPYLIVFTNGKLQHKGGTCSKVNEVIRMKYGVDYIIKIQVDTFLQYDNFNKVQLLIHELNHIGYEGDKPKIREHTESYCEIPEHDKFSKLATSIIISKLNIPTNWTV